MMRHTIAHGLTLRAEKSPLAADLIGLGAIQSALAIGAAALMRRCGPIAPQLAGAARTGIGHAALVQQLVPAP